MFIYLCFHLTKVNNSLLCARCLDRKFLNWVNSTWTLGVWYCMLLKDWTGSLHQASRKKPVSWVVQMLLDSCFAAIRSPTWRNTSPGPKATWSPWPSPRSACTSAWMTGGRTPQGPHPGTRSASSARCLCPPWSPTSYRGTAPWLMIVGTSGLCSWMTGTRSSASESSRPLQTQGPIF